MSRVITYGTFDLLHDGHIRLLERARNAGNYLIVGVTSERYDERRGKLSVHDSLAERIENVRKTGLADKIIVEEYEGQKVDDIQRYSIDLFAIGSDWTGHFDYLNQLCKVQYLERTAGVSSTESRAVKSGIVRIGIVGTGRIANRFVQEAKFVSSVSVEHVFSRRYETASKFRQTHSLGLATKTYDDLLDQIDAVYIATPHESHYDYARRALAAGRHVLCEKPLTLSCEETSQLYSMADISGLVLLEGIKTAFSPGFLRLCSLAQSGTIGEIMAVDATFTRLTGPGLRETSGDSGSGSLTELGSYPLLAIARLLGTEPTQVICDSIVASDSTVDALTRVSLKYERAVATATVALGAKSEGDLRIAGTKGYIYVPSPWWKTSRIEIRGEDASKNVVYVEPFQGDGLRYELSEFSSMIQSKSTHSYKLNRKTSEFIQSIISMSPTIR
ncbi:Gfo/Idh/MocA family oxidoreductase [Arthrobacter sp. lap29]|uniref:Gfo/Idh/MocA family oxidoreductase n=1 Tax=Arthrobacter sp. lap29 TaxID=3056122 RepID=UPI0028F73A8A|nr:Gfo/Idh/MocA family oxidoreductase [Arthrobacter sp. lap29]